MVVSPGMHLLESFLLFFVGADYPVEAVGAAELRRDVGAPLPAAFASAFAPTRLRARVVPERFIDHALK